jgi:hypothetical protein
MKKYCQKEREAKIGSNPAMTSLGKTISLFTGPDRLAPRADMHHKRSDYCHTSVLVFRKA